MDLVGYLGGDLVKHQCGVQTDNAAGDTGCNGHQVGIPRGELSARRYTLRLTTFSAPESRMV
ncbi:MAG: hypothetical protein WA151_22370 [Desulfatirhabdiaceae bacterium]